MNFTTAEINALVGAYLWPMFRVAAVIATAPILGARYVPARIKVMMTLAFTVVIAPTLTDVPAVDPISIQALTIVAQQILVGAATGLIMAMVFSAFMIGGEFVATTIGLGFASIVDPQQGVQTPVLSQFYVILLSLVFVSINGHLLLIHELANSFRTLPIAPEGMPREMLWGIAAWGSEMFRTGVLMALPAVTTLFIVNVALGIVMRAAPQFNILSIGFPVTLTIGFMIVLITLPVVLPLFESLLTSGFDVIRVIFSRSP